MKADAAPHEAFPPSGRAAAWDGLDVLVLSPTPTAPLDAGNRRRIYHLTQALRRMGARIVFAHYPAEAGWRERTPRAALAAMGAQWDELHTIPVTRPLHTAPALGPDHSIDEWWDPAIGDMLGWLFATHPIDVLIVNYTWLSRAFEFCPPGVLKVLDTHDRFSDRRLVLERHGIDPEFFHTTLHQERIGLARADVVWSIKPQEASFFRTLGGVRRVINIPYVEPITGSAPAIRAGRPASGANGCGGIVRFGITGARNSINRCNIETFLGALVAHVERTLLPCEVLIVGSVCELLAAPDAAWTRCGWAGLPWIRLLGRVEELDDFYREVDVVLAPIAFSTGLKIKVGEALCHGKAVVALAHAFEGFPARHDFHRLDSVQAMLAACHAIVDEPGLIDELERLSLLSVLEMQAALAHGLAETIAERDRDNGRPGVCLVVSADDVFTGSLVLDHVLEAAPYLAHLASLSIHVDGGADGSVHAGNGDIDRVADVAALRRLRAIGPVTLSPGLAGGSVARALHGGPYPVRSMSMADRLRRPNIALWFASRPQSWPLPDQPLAWRAYVQIDTVQVSSSAAEVAEFLARVTATFRETVALSRRSLHDGTAPRCMRVGTLSEHRTPVFWRGEQSRVLAHLRDCPRDSVVVLADAADEPLLALTIAAVRRMSDRPIDVILPGCWPPVVGPDRKRNVRYLDAARCFQGLDDGGLASRDALDAQKPVCPALVLDIAVTPALDCLRETFDRAPVRYVRLFAEGRAPAHGAWGPPHGAAGLWESLMLLQGLLSDQPAMTPLHDAESACLGSYGQDAGWAWIWDEIRELVAVIDDNAVWEAGDSSRREEALA